MHYFLICSLLFIISGGTVGFVIEFLYLKLFLHIVRHGTLNVAVLTRLDLCPSFAYEFVVF